MNPRARTRSSAHSKGWSAALWSSAVVLSAILLGSSFYAVHADGGGWPTATPTETRQSLVVTPIPGKDVLPPTPTSTSAPAIVGDAPLPPGGQEAKALQADVENAAPAPPTEAVRTTGINWRMVGIGGGIAAGLLLLLLLFFRLR